MLEERARVLTVEPGMVWVEADRAQGCAKCEAGEGCGGGVLGKLVKRGSTQVQVHNTLPGLAPGDDVIIGLDERALLRTSVMTYLVPLLALFAGAILTEMLLQPADPVIAAGGITGLIAGYLILRYFSARVSANPSYQPHVLRRAPVVSEGCRVYVPQK